MYLFNRTTKLTGGNQRESLAWAMEITEKVNQITSLNVNLWQTLFSPEVGRLGWTCVVESLSDLEDADAKLNVDNVFLDIADRGAQFTNGELDDELAQILGEVDPNANPTHVAVVRTTMANGQFARGVEVGLEIAQRATTLGGLNTIFLLSSTGGYASCGWITGATSLKELEQSEAAVNANPDFVAFIDSEAANCYLPGVTTQSMYRRII